jgi:hypothetical protein
MSHAGALIQRQGFATSHLAPDLTSCPRPQRHFVSSVSQCRAVLQWSFTLGLKKTSVSVA